MAFRRVITGHDSTGAAVFLSDEMVDSISAGGFSYDPLWATDNAPVVPNDGSIPTGIDFFPAPGGSRVVTWIAEPHGAVAPESTLEEFEAAAPGMASFMEADDPGMHTTPTIDIDVVLSGEIWMEVDNGHSYDMVTWAETHDLAVRWIRERGSKTYHYYVEELEEIDAMT